VRTFDSDPRINPKREKSFTSPIPMCPLLPERIQIPPTRRYIAKRLIWRKLEGLLLTWTSSIRAKSASNDRFGITCRLTSLAMIQGDKRINGRHELIIKTRESARSRLATIHNYLRCARPTASNSGRKESNSTVRPLKREI
jgi:hypothetical protein